MPENIIAVALPWQDITRASLVGYRTPIEPGSVLRSCLDCGMALAVGPGTQLALAAEPAIVLCCPICGVGRTRDAAYVVEVNLSRVGPVH